MKSSNLFFTIIALMSGIFLFSCNSNRKQLPRVPIAYQSYPFYKDFAALDTKHLQTGLLELKAKYPDFLDFYLDTLIGLGVDRQYSDSNNEVLHFLTYKDFHNLFDTVNKAFPDTKEQDRQIKAALQNIRYLDSAFIIPSRVFYFVSSLHFSAVTHNDTDLGIGLDMFLGRDFAPYASVGIPEYATIRFTRENIPVWACRTIYQNRFPFEFEERNLLEMMLEKGKEIYFLKKALPDLPEHLLLGFSTEQMKWCAANEALIYNFFIQNNLLYEKNLQKIMRYVNDGPSTPGFEPQSPGNLGSFIGWKIITSYAANRGTDLETTLTLKDAQAILSGAKYKP